MPTEVRKLNKGGGEVRLATWENLQPPQHDQKLVDRKWDDHGERKDLKFYPSTIAYMRNTWAMEHMDRVDFDIAIPVRIRFDGGKDVDVREQKMVSLFYSPDTDSWHTIDALDIDHKVRWEEYLETKGVRNHADANMAYNDLDNLRLLPSLHNRSRDKVEGILQGGPESEKMREWRRSNLEFDHEREYRPFDPEKDNARRKNTTLTTEWTIDMGRKGLGFDTRVKGLWKDHELSEMYACTVTIVGDTNGKQYEIPLFRCPATHQLVTRDALDVDHEVPFAKVLQDIWDTSGSRMVTKAQVLDSYNDVSNLRLVVRSANASHEWELGMDGEFDDDPRRRKTESDSSDNDRQRMDSGEEDDMSDSQDLDGGRRDTIREEDDDEYGSEFDDFIDDTVESVRLNEFHHPNHAMFVEVMRSPLFVNLHENQEPVDDMAATLVRMAVQNGIDRIDAVWFDEKTDCLWVAQREPPMEDRRVSVLYSEAASVSLERNSDMLGVVAGSHDLELFNAISEFRERDRRKMQVAVDLSERDIIDFEYKGEDGRKRLLMNDPLHPDYADFVVARHRIDLLDPSWKTLPEGEHRDNLAAALVMNARLQGIDRIENIVLGGQQNSKLFAMQGAPSNPFDSWQRNSSTDVTEGVRTPIDYSTSCVDKCREHQSQSQSIVSNTNQQHRFI